MRWSPPLRISPSRVLGVTESPIRGGDGNVEWLVWGTRT